LQYRSGNNVSCLVFTPDGTVEINHLYGNLKLPLFNVNGQMYARSATVNALLAKEFTAGELYAVNASVTTLTARSATIDNALTADELTVNSANISKTISVNELSASKATITTTLTAGLLNAQNATIEGLTKTHNLRVNNLLCAKEIKVQLNSTWPDYVFAKDYNLLPLSEVEQFINENHHLPHIPSAAEVEENGINIGEMNAKLLLKVEELTLYIIQMEKRLAELENRNVVISD